MIRPVVGWVTCLNCDHSFYLERYGSKIKHTCPVCGSSEYEPDEEGNDEDFYLYVEGD